MAICTDSGCTTTNFDAIGRGSSYINSECIRANLAKAPEAVCIIAIGFNGTVCSEIDNKSFSVRLSPWRCSPEHRLSGL